MQVIAPESYIDREHLLAKMYYHFGIQEGTKGSARAIQHWNNAAGELAISKGLPLVHRTYFSIRRNQLQFSETAGTLASLFISIPMY